MTFEQLDRSIDADSDSDDELAEQAHMYRSTSLTPTPYAHSHQPYRPDLFIPSYDFNPPP